MKTVNQNTERPVPLIYTESKIYEYIQTITLINYLKKSSRLTGGAWLNSPSCKTQFSGKKHI